MTSTSATRAAALLLALSACRSPAGGADSAGSTGSGDDGLVDGGGETSLSGDLVLQDTHNYSFSGVLDGPSFEMKEYQDFTLSWAGLEQDLQCHDLDPVADIDNVALMVFKRLSEEEVEAGLSADSLEQVDLAVYLSFEPGDATEVKLSDVSFFGTDPAIEEEFAEGSGTWMFVFTTGTDIGVGSRMIAFVHPSADPDAGTAASLTDGCSVLDASADLSSLTSVPVPAAGPWTVDWTAVTQTGIGTPFQPLDVTEVMVARYEQDLATLEAHFLDLELLAAELYTMPHPGGRTADLSGLSRVDDGSPFPGFDADGTWLLALRCRTCANPAPLFLTVLEPAP